MPEAYKVRAGGAIAPAHLTFEEVMLQRFGHTEGYITDDETAGVPGV